jgi:hypothetical protein
MHGYKEDVFVENLKGKKCIWARVDAKGNAVIQIEKEEYNARFTSYSHWHEVLSHPSPAALINSKDLYSDSNLLPLPPTNFYCQSCALSKITKQIPPPSHNRAKEKHDLMHIDLSGQFSTQSLGKKYYYMTFLDDTTRHAWIYFLHRKEDAEKCIKDFVRKRERQTGRKIKCF